MPRGPKGEKRPADVNARAVMIGKIATGEIEGRAPDARIRGQESRRRSLGPHGWQSAGCRLVGPQAQGNRSKGRKKPVENLAAD